MSETLTLDFARRHPDSFARVLARGDLEDCEELIGTLPAALKANIIARLPSQRIDQLLDSDAQQPAHWLVDAPFDDAVQLLSRIPRERRIALVHSIDNRARRQQLLRNQQYAAHSIGAITGGIPLRVSAQLAAAEVLTELRGLDPRVDAAAVVVDVDGSYLGVLDHWRLALRNQPAGQARDYIVAVKPARPEMAASAIASDRQWGSRNWLPVVDNRRRVLGRVSRDKVLQAAEHDPLGRTGSSDIVLDLFADFMHLCDAVLAQLSGRRDSP